MAAQVLFLDVYFEKDPHLNAVESPLNFGNSSFGSFFLTCDVMGSDEEESCEFIEGFEVLSYLKHLSTFAKCRLSC